MSPPAKMEDATVMVAGCSERANRMPRTFNRCLRLVPERRDGGRKFQHLKSCSLSRQADLLVTFTGSKSTGSAIAKALSLLGCWETIGHDIHAIGVGSPTRGLQKDRARSYTLAPIGRREAPPKLFTGRNPQNRKPVCRPITTPLGRYGLPAIVLKYWNVGCSTR